MKTSDIEVFLYETLKNIDVKWLSRLLVCLVVHHRDGMSDGERRYLLAGKDSRGSALLAKDILQPYLTKTSIC